MSTNGSRSPLFTDIEATGIAASRSSRTNSNPVLVQSLLAAAAAATNPPFAGGLLDVNSLPRASVNDASTATMTGNDMVNAYLQFFANQQQTHEAVLQHYSHLARNLQAHAQQQRQQRSQEKKRSYPSSFQWCELCKKNVHSSKLPCHIRQCHVAKPMFRCPACDFTSTYSKNNVKSHMVSLHGLADEPISYMEDYAGQVEEYMKLCFPNVRGRGRPIHGHVSNRSPVSPSSPKSTDSNSSRRGSLNSVQSNISIGSQGRYTHSHRRKGTKHAAQTPIHELLAMANAKRVKDEINNKSNVTVSQETPVPSEAPSDFSFPVVAVKPEGVNEGELEMMNGSALSDAENNRNSPGRSKTVVIDTESNGWDSSRLDVSEQLVRPGENIQPRYLPQNADWQILSIEQLRGTVFESLKLNHMLDKFSRHPFDVLVGNAGFLTDEQLKRVEKVRKQISLGTVHLCLAFRHLDLNLLPIEQVDLIASIAPSTVDVSRLLNYECTNPGSVTGENEQFLLSLAKIDHLEERLHAMSFMGHFYNHFKELNRQFDDLNNAAKVLRNSHEFQVLLRIVVVYINFVLGDFNAETVRGCRASALMEMCSVELSQTPKTTMLSVVAATVSKQFPDVAKFRETLPALEKAARVKFQDLALAVRRLERGYMRFILVVAEHGEEADISEFVDHAEKSIRDLQNAYVTCRNALILTLRFFGEPVDEDDGPEHPELFFGRIATFCRKLQMASLDLHLQLPPDDQNQ